MEDSRRRSGVRRRAQAARPLLLLFASLALLGAGPLDGLARIGASASVSATSLHQGSTKTSAAGPSRGSPTGADRQFLQGPPQFRVASVSAAAGSVGAGDVLVPLTSRGKALPPPAPPGRFATAEAPAGNSGGAVGSRAPPGTASTDASLPTRP